MCRDICGDMCGDMCGGMCGDAFVDMCADVCVGTCADMRVSRGACLLGLAFSPIMYGSKYFLYSDMYVDVCRHVCWHVHKQSCMPPQVGVILSQTRCPGVDTCGTCVQICV
jgi:hypothetical protein